MTRAMLLAAGSLAAGLLATSLPVGTTLGAQSPIAFEDITARTGLDRWSSSYGAPLDKRTILENIGGGAALIDLDGDGLLDAYLPTGQDRDGDERRNAFFRGRHGPAFELAPTASGIALDGWSFGVAAADYDDDGHRDLYVTRHGGNRLLRNNGDGTFSDVTRATDTGLGGFGAGAAWADFDRDGWLDLAVANYVVVDPATAPPPGSGPHCTWKGVAVPCGPRGLPGERAFLLRGDGAGGFRPAAGETLSAADFYGLGVVWSDHDRDGWTDLYIADDQTPNRLLLNEKGSLREAGLMSGTAYSEDGHAEAGMGVDWVDVDGNGLADLFVTNFADETNTLYLGIAPGLFRDATVAADLAVPSFRQVGWGTGFRDFDRDGDPDLFIANGHVYSQVDTHGLLDSYPQADQLFLNREGRFEEWTPGAADALSEPAVSRGAAFGDVDRDGRVDVLVNVLDGPPRLLASRLPGGGHVQVRLLSRGGNRSGVGARVEVEAPGLPLQVREVQAGHSFLSQSDTSLPFGLGDAGSATIRVHWPSGAIAAPQTVTGVPAGATVLIVRDGQPVIRHRP